MKSKITMSHAKFQYYRHNYCLICMTGLLGCRWHRYQQSTRDSRKRDLFWFTVLTIAFLYIIFYLYFWLIANNDYNDFEWFLFGKLKKWVPWYRIMVALTAIVFAYCFIVMVLSLCHVGHGHQLYIHPVHLVLVMITLLACIVVTIVINNLWKSEWASVYISLQMMGPFLHIGAVILMTALMWLIVYSWYTLSGRMFKFACLMALIAVMTALYISPLFINCPCLNSASKTPQKPNIFAHRGAEYTAPENSVIAFQRAVDLGVYGLESDVRISYDGVPFLMHDSTLRRTTNVENIFPGREDEDCSSFNMSELQQLNAGSWFVEKDPFYSANQVSDSDREIFNQQKIPTLAWLLEFAEQKDMALMFDVRRPVNQDHPFYNSTFDIVFQTVANSSFNVSKLYWLVELNNISMHPAGALLTYPGVAGLQELQHLNISNINVPFDSVHSDQIRYYSHNNISSIIWVINSHWLFSYFWCSEATTVTTSRSELLMSAHLPIWTMRSNSYLILWVSIDVISAILIIVILIVQRIRLFGTSFNPESITLTSARKTDSNQSRTMKEKLLRDVVLDPIDETDIQAPGIINHQPSSYSISSLSTDSPSQPDRKYAVE